MLPVVFNSLQPVVWRKVPLYGYQENDWGALINLRSSYMFTEERDEPRANFFSCFFSFQMMLHHAFLENVPWLHAALHGYANRCSDWSCIRKHSCSHLSACTSYRLWYFLYQLHIYKLKNMQSHTHDLILKSHLPHLSVTPSAQSKIYEQPPGIILGMLERFTG